MLYRKPLKNSEKLRQFFATPKNLHSPTLAMTGAIIASPWGWRVAQKLDTSLPPLGVKQGPAFREWIYDSALHGGPSVVAGVAAAGLAGMIMRRRSAKKSIGEHAAISQPLNARGYCLAATAGALAINLGREMYGATFIDWRFVAPVVENISPTDIATGTGAMIVSLGAAAVAQGFKAVCSKERMPAGNFEMPEMATPVMPQGYASEVA